MACGVQEDILVASRLRRRFTLASVRLIILSGDAGRDEAFLMITRRAIVLCAASFGVACLQLPSAHAEGPPEGRRIALSGYDVVAYFEDGQPAKGSREFWSAFDDVIYLFRSAQHRDTFASDAERFAPQYDGYCAAAVSKGYKAEPDPEAWLIANGKLYVFQFKDRVPSFRNIIGELAAKADENWQSLKSK